MGSTTPPAQWLLSTHWGQNLRLVSDHLQNQAIACAANTGARTV